MTTRATQAIDLTRGARVSASMKLGITPAGGVKTGTCLGSKDAEDIFITEKDSNSVPNASAANCSIGIAGRSGCAVRHL